MTFPENKMSFKVFSDGMDSRFGLLTEISLCIEIGSTRFDVAEKNIVSMTSRGYNHLGILGYM